MNNVRTLARTKHRQLRRESLEGRIAELTRTNNNLAEMLLEARRDIKMLQIDGEVLLELVTADLQLTWWKRRKRPITPERFLDCRKAKLEQLQGKLAAEGISAALRHLHAVGIADRAIKDSQAKEAAESYADTSSRPGSTPAQ